MKLTIPLYKFIYINSKGRIKKKNIQWKYGERMSDEEFEKCLEIVKECKLLNK